VHKGTLRCIKDERQVVYVRELIIKYQGEEITCIYIYFPFRLTPNLTELITNVGVSGPLTASMIAAARLAH
jgi:hypothetical protein